MHALASALRLHGCELSMCVYFTTENTGFDSYTCTWTLQRWISMHGKGMCPMRRPTSRVHVHVHHQNDQDPGKFHITRLQCILLSVVCYAAQERQKAFRSGSPQNALHCLVYTGTYPSPPSPSPLLLPPPPPPTWPTPVPFLQSPQCLAWCLFSCLGSLYKSESYVTMLSQRTAAACDAMH